MIVGLGTGRLPNTQALAALTAAKRGVALKARAALVNLCSDPSEQSLIFS